MDRWLIGKNAQLEMARQSHTDATYRAEAINRML
jgi:hypothetical protein